MPPPKRTWVNNEPADAWSAANVNDLEDRIFGYTDEEIADRQAAFSAHVALDDPHGTRAYVKPLFESAGFTPAHQGHYYPCAPWAVGTTSTGQTLNRLYLTPMFAAHDITIDKEQVEVASTAGAGAVHRVGYYQIVNQNRPFSWSTGAVWATLLIENATTFDCSTTGTKSRTNPDNYVQIYKNTWYAVADVGQVAAHELIRGVGATGIMGPLGGTASGSAWLTAPFQSLYVDSITGALPTSFTPAGGSTLSCALAIARNIL